MGLFNLVKVNIRLAGGFGNQLFQLAALERVLANHGHLKSVNVDPTFLSNYSVSREFTSKIILDCMAQYYSLKITEKRSIISQFRVGKLPNLYFSNIAAVNKVSDIDKLKYHRFVAMDGYFQTSKILFSTQFLNFLNYKVIQPRFRELKNIEGISNYTALHVRRKDYMDKKSAAVFHFLSERYYDDAVQLFNRPSNLLIFSDCINTGSAFADRYKATFYSKNSTGAFEDFLVMSNAKSIILANSTFSWFAGIFGRKNKQIVLPLNWHKNPSSDFHHDLGDKGKYIHNVGS